MLLFIEGVTPRLDPARSPLSNIWKKFSQLAVFILLKGSVVLTRSDLEGWEVVALIIIAFIAALITIRCEKERDAFIIIPIGWTVIIFRCCPSGPYIDDRDPELLLMAVGVAAAQLAAAYEIDVDPEG
jgi:hypothetical protein